MFDIGWSEFLIFAVVALILVGPKEMPVFMRTIGRYAGVLRRQADEFRGHFDAAMQEAEIDQMRSDLENFGKGVSDSLESAKSDVDETVAAVEDRAALRVNDETSETPDDEAAESLRPLERKEGEA
ncbi:MAG: Sec-independent protein translocase protein TatB [Alphaproteobacteria bacterium]|nr:Sec-independent protein translocase protein TatB [Alphaproteobacteria bacterium]